MFNELQSKIIKDDTGNNLVSIKNFQQFEESLNRKQIMHLIEQLTDIKNDMKGGKLIQVKNHEQVLMIPRAQIKSRKTSRRCHSCIRNYLSFIPKGPDVCIDNYCCDACGAFFIEK